MSEELPPGWALAPLDKIADVVGGITKGPTTNDVQLREVPYLRVANVQRGHLDLRELKTIRAPERDIDKLRLQVGDVLFTEGGDRDKLGRGWIWSGEIAECIHQNHIFRARMKSPEILPKFVSWYGNTEGLEYFLSNAKQTTNLASVNMTTLRGLPVKLPPAREQKRITDKLDALLARVDACRERLDRVPGILKRFRQSVLATATSGGLTREWRATAGDWQEVAIEDLLADRDKLSYGVLKPGKEDAAGVPMYRVMDIGEWGRRSPSQPLRISNVLADEYRRTRVEPGDILLSIMATIGRALVASDDMAGANVNRAITVIKPHRSKANSRFLLFHLLSPRAIREFETKSMGSAQVRINLGDLRKFKVSLPNLAEQLEIVRRADALLTWADALEERFQAAARAASYVPSATFGKAFRGELVPQDPNDEPASALLARIASAQPESATRPPRRKKAG